MVNSPEYIIAMMGIIGIGAVAVPLNSWWVPKEVTYGLQNSEAKLLIADDKRLVGLDAVSYTHLTLPTNSLV